MMDVGLQVAALPDDVLAHPDFEAALKLALQILENENVLPMVVDAWATAEVTRAGR